MGRPWLYKVTQLAMLDAVILLNRLMKRVLSDVPPTKLFLDVGCGPFSRFSQGAGIRPIGIDISWSYVHSYMRNGLPGLVASADTLPFPTNSLDVIWSLGLFHHLPDSVAADALREIVRVCRPGGHIIILDAVLPRRGWRRPVAALIRNLDRGKHMRKQHEFASLLPDGMRWSLSRRTYAISGLELLICTHVKE